MPEPIPHFAQRLKTLRKERGLTQQELADRMGLKRAALGAYEEGRAEPRLINVVALAEFFGVTVDALLKGEHSDEARTRGQSMRVLSVMVDAATEEERVAVVPVKAAAGYLSGYGDPEYVQGLPTFGLPLPEVTPNLTHRLFQIEGESMLPVPSGSYILSTFEEDWHRIGGMRPYVVLTREHGVVFKRIENRLDTEHKDFWLISDNPDFPPYSVKANEVVEVWRARGYLAFDWPTPAFSGMERIQGTLDSLRAEIHALKATR
ncbi:MAG TPA: transcriptional regulator [Flavobacteriales bacterium]|jgi:transcriptional regulator with XRE-family HTH domain|nr:transcriptional regulator [Flavobacteriales bacterium]